MKFIDRILQNWRIDKVRKHIAPGAKILDIGSADGALFQRLGAGVGPGSMGIDPTLNAPSEFHGFRLQPGYFPQAMPASTGVFDVITLLAVLEHFPDSAHEALRAGCAQYLRPGGRLLITVPSAQVDSILKWLSFFRLIDGMSLEEHHGYEVADTPKIFHPPDFQLILHQPFQVGLNHLFVFERSRRADAA